MNYPLRPETMYMMPTHFGPMSGPRQGPNGKKFAFARDQRKSMGVSVSFLTNAEQPWYGAFHPIAGNELGYNDQKVIEIRALIEAISTGKPAEPDFRFGYENLQVVDAVVKSVDERRWVRTDEVG